MNKHPDPMNEMWEALERYQPYADKHGFGAEWKRMTTERTKEAVWALRRPNSPLRAKDDAAYYAVCAVCASESKAAVVVGREAATVADAIRLINEALKLEELK